MKLPAFFLRFQNEERVLRVNKSKITGENAFNGDLFEIDDNHNQVKTKKLGFSLFCGFVTRTYVYLRFSSIVWFLQF